MLFTSPDALICSRAGCTLPATKALIWANPKIHTTGRTKTWLACTEHLQYLTEFLTARNFLLEVKEVTAL